MTGTIFLLFAFAAAAAQAADLSPATLKEFQAYMRKADQAMQARPSSATRLAAKAGAAPVIEAWQGGGVTEVTDGMIHDWIGAIFVPNAKLSDAVSVLQDLARYKDIYKEVKASRTVDRQGNRASLFMRLLKKKVITVVLDTYYDVEYREAGPGKYQILSKSTRIAEVSGPGTKDEKVSPPDTGFGFLWRLNSYWLLEERDGGVYMELRAISLTRDIPTGLAWAVKPMVTSLPRESLTSTLYGTAKAMAWYSRQN